MGPGGSTVTRSAPAALIAPAFARTFHLKEGLRTLKTRGHFLTVEKLPRRMAGQLG